MTALWQILYAAFGAVVAVLAGCALAGIAWPAALRIGRVALRVAVALGLLGLAARTWSAGHLPIFGTFENTYVASWCLIAGALWFSRRYGSDAGWRLIVPWAVALLLYGTRFRSGPVPLTISEQSMWVEIHVALAWVGFTALIGASVLSLRWLRRAVPAHLAPGEDDELVHQRLMLTGYLGLTAMLVTGSWYLYLLFGTFWRWEIVETLSLVAWLAYGMLIHGRLFYRWSGRWYHISVVAVLPVLLLAFWVWSVFPGTFHYFEIPLVRPY
jgi:ABC-type transport system involved in cytochrome c biogenesis permease subunit